MAIQEAGLLEVSNVLTDVREFPPGFVGVVADTHVHEGGSRTMSDEVPELFARYEVEIILHAGDVNDMGVIDRLGQVAPVIAVAGNNDAPQLAQYLQEREQLRVGDVRIGLIHGQQGKTARETARNSFLDQVDIVVYGHSHIPKIERDHSRILFNPGSPTDRRWSEHFGIGMLDCTTAQVEPTLILFRSPDELRNLGPAHPASA